MGTQSIWNCNWSRGALLPINAGSGGLLSLLLITLLAYPVMYSHRALAKMIYASNSADEDHGTIRVFRK